jgi:2,4-dienoyl-CoA reductase (NADPH2)
MVSMARPFLADADFVNKAAAGRADEINTCIACNQACLDHTFRGKRASCLVNPRACHETELIVAEAGDRTEEASPWSAPARPGWPAPPRRRARPSVTCSTAAEIGGQFNLAKQHPGQGGVHETLRYFRTRIERPASTLQLGTRVVQPSADLGRLRPGRRWPPASPRAARHPGIDHPKVLSYLDVLRGRSRWASGGDHRRRRHRLRRGRVPAARRRQPRAWTRPTLLCRVGHRPHYRNRGGLAAAPRPAGAQGLPAAAQDQQGRRRPGQDHRLDPPHCAQEPWRAR